jgi:hypothetical protein
MSTICINQPEGLGDIIFLMTLVRRLAEVHDARRVLWPVNPQWVEGLRRAYPDIDFIDKQEVRLDYEAKAAHTWMGMSVIPLRWAHEHVHKGPMDFMRAKYEMYSQDWTTWKMRGEFERTDINEIALYSRLNPGQKINPYTLINNRYKSDESGIYSGPLFKLSTQEVVVMESIPNFSLFDWSRVIMNAREIHTVGTSLIYLLELLQPTCKIYIYPRIPQHRDHRRYEYILRSCDYVLK